jgi:hypothetical protein
VVRRDSSCLEDSILNGITALRELRIGRGRLHSFQQLDGLAFGNRKANVAEAAAGLSQSV